VDELSRLRAELDVIDSRIVTEIGARLAKAREIGAAKAAMGSVVRDPARERIVLDGVRAQAEAIGSNPDLTEEVFTLLIHGALRVQNHDPSND
jgi:chorismate mutase